MGTHHLESLLINQLSFLYNHNKFPKIPSAKIAHKKGFSHLHFYEPIITSWSKFLPDLAGVGNTNDVWQR